MELSKPHILFVCGRNRWRSPTAQRLYANDSRVIARSAGVSGSSTHQISAADIEWADLILVMEDEYASWIRRNFRALRLPPVKSLGIADEYEFMDAELVELIQNGVEPYIDQIVNVS
jgi:predicted protein tyrosine phosphatase